MKIPMKLLTGVCADCAAPFSMEIPANITSQTLCGDCSIKFQQKRDQERRLEVLETLANDCGLQQKYWSWDESIAKQLGADKLLEWLRPRCIGSLWVGGTNGIGKTHAVSYAAYRLLEKRGICSYAVRASTWLRQVMAMRMSKDPAQAEKIYARAVSCSILILDDLGKENLTEARAELLYDIVDERDRHQRHLWITTNFSGAELENRLNNSGDSEHSHEYGYAIMKRLRRMIGESNQWR